jgi:lipopolysaccharide/colanic/teichoic acid biosynthesis glycosyltransferase
MSMIAVGDLRSNSLPPPRERFALWERGVAPASRLYTICKPAFDFTFALLLLVLAAPAVATAMLLIKLTSRGSALYTQTRLGRKGRPFVIYKLRTMIHKCETQTGVRWATPADPRVTPLGRFLRKTHLDELPQLWNVLRGDMSLVGPRPERPEFVPQLAQAIPCYSARLLMKPGVTGLAQVQLPPDTNLASVRLKLAYDLYYIKHVSLWLDCRIIASTALKMLSLRFAVMRWLFGFPRPETVQDKHQLLPSEANAPATRAQTA